MPFLHKYHQIKGLSAAWTRSWQLLDSTLWSCWLVRELFSLVFSRRPKWSKVRERAHPAHMCDCEPLIYVPLTAVGHRLRSTYFRLLMVYLFKPRSALCAR